MLERYGVGAGDTNCLVKDVGNRPFMCAAKRRAAFLDTETRQHRTRVCQDNGGEEDRVALIWADHSAPILRLRASEYR